MTKSTRFPSSRLALADSAKKYVSLGIYAVEKDGVLELKMEAAQSKTQLKRMVREYKEKGFKVWWNESRISVS